MRDVLVRTLTAVVSIAAAIAELPAPAAQRADPELLWLSSFNIKTLQRDLQTAADRGYRLVLPTGDYFGFGERIVLVERTTAQPEPVEYLLLRGAGEEKEMNEAAVKGYRLAGTFNNLFVMQRRRGTTIRTHEYGDVGTRLKQSMENELLVAVARGFRVVGLTTRSVVGIRSMLGGQDRELVAILERPVQAAEAVHPEYLILYSLKASTTQAELQAAADRGFRLLPFQGGWGSTVLLEKAGDIEPVEYLVISTAKTGTMQTEMGKASAEGYRFASTFGSGFREFVIAMQRPRGARVRAHEQVVLATSRFKTMERESLAQMANGFRLVGLTSFDSIMGTYLGRGPEGVAILERRVQ